MYYIIWNYVHYFLYMNTKNLYMNGSYVAAHYWEAPTVKAYSEDKTLFRRQCLHLN